MAVDHVARIRNALRNTSPPRLAAGDALVSLDALVVQAAFWERRYKALRTRWNAAFDNPEPMRVDRDFYLSKCVELKAENQQLREGPSPEQVAEAKGHIDAVIELMESNNFPAITSGMNFTCSHLKAARRALAAVVEE